MDNIKSKFIIKIILSHLNNKNELKLIKYNKWFQNIMNLTIINYKILTGKYIEYSRTKK